MKGTVPVGGVWKRSLLLCRGKNSCRVCRSVNGRKKMCQFIHNWLQCANSWQRCHEIEVSLSADGWMALWSSNLHILCVCVLYCIFVPTRPQNVNPLLKVKGGQSKWQHTPCVFWPFRTSATVNFYRPRPQMSPHLFAFYLLFHLPLTITLALIFCSEVRSLIRVKWTPLQMWRGFVLSLLISALVSSLFISSVYS